MHRTPSLPDSSVAFLPNLAWLALTQFVLTLAYRVFALSRKLHHLRLVDWIGIRILRFALRALGHAPAHSNLEFRADLPVQI